MDRLMVPKDMLVGGGTEKIIIGVKDALTTIDGNRDFSYPDGALYFPGLDGEADDKEIIHTIHCSHMHQFGFKAVTDEGHPEGHVEFDKFGRHCVLGSPGQKYHEELVQDYLNADERLMKGMNRNVIGHSISMSPQFADHIGTLRQKQIENVYVNGYLLTHCAGDAALAYAEQWFNVYIIRDGTRSAPAQVGDLKAMEIKLRLNNVKYVFYDQLSCA